MGAQIIPHRRFSRRRLLQGIAAAASAGSIAEAQDTVAGADGYRVWFGDLHNHGNVGYAQGSLRRLFEIAKNHLDFVAFTPHASWHDIGHYENNAQDKWINGFAVTRARWPEVVKTAQAFDEPGKFVTIVGYEWHSTSIGDYHVIFPDHDAELFLPNDPKELQAFARKRGCILIPHHPANPRGHRGANPALWDPAVSPVLEMYSEWGNAEHDRGPYPYIRHTEGGRWTKNTVQYLLAHGMRTGLIASTDDHLGYPGGYGEGLAAVLATNLSREGIFDALRNRRTYAVTGDRILLHFTLNGSIMGQELPYAANREIRVSTWGWDQVDRIEVLKNNAVIHREFPMDRRTSAQSWRKPFLLRLEYGWGPWPALGAARVCDWDFRVGLEGGVLEKVGTCFLSGPFDEDRRDRVVEKTDRAVRVRSFTALRDQIEDRSQKAIVLEMRGDADTRLTFTLNSPAKMEKSLRLAELAESSAPLYTGDFPKESAMLNRIVFNENFESSFVVRDEDPGAEDHWYYVRVVQANGQLAWSSPIWVGRQG